MSGRQVLMLLAVLAGLAIAATPTSATTWDLAGDFDTASNPSNSGNGPWSYGYYTLPYFVYNVTYSGHSTFDPRCSVWSVGESTYQTGYIAKNISGSAFQDALNTAPWWFGTAMEQGMVVFENADREGGNNRFRQIAAEWTSPGNYAALRITAQFTGQGAYTYPDFQSSDVHVLYRGGVVFDGKLNGFHGTLANGYTDSTGGPSNIQTYNTVIYNVKAGDKIAFTTGNDGTPYYEQVGVGATITTDVGTTRSISGTVNKVGAGAVSGAKVYAVETSAATTTDSSGNYTLSLAPGVYTVKATKTGYHGLTQSVDTTTDNMAGVNFSLYDNYWNVNEDYSLANGNPNGQWSYAYKLSNDFSNPNLYSYTVDYGQYPLQQWYGNGDWGWAAKNTTPYAVDLWGMHWEPWQTFLYNTDWRSDTKTLYRWTSPVTNNVRVSAKFTGIVVAGQTCPVKVIKNNTSPGLFSGTINGFVGRATAGYTDSFGTAPTLTYSAVVAVNSNDVLDFQIGDSYQQACALDATVYVMGNGTISGIVRSSTGSVISGATVSVDGTQTTTTTAFDGSYALTLAEGTYNLTTTKANYGPTYTTGVAVTTQLTTTKDIVLTHSRITGTVKDCGGVGISGATVSTNTGGYNTSTASDGTYSLDINTPATYDLTATKGGYVTAQRYGVYAADGTTSGQNITMQQKWDAASDFSTSTNNTGTWSYGLVSRTTGAFTLLTSMQTPYTGLSGWLYGANAWAIKSYYGSAHSFDGIWMENGAVALSPNTPCGQPSDMTALRWTAPATGHYSLSVIFRGTYFAQYQQQYLANSYVFIEKNVTQGGPELFRGVVYGFAGTAANQYTDSLGTSPVQSYSCFVDVNSGDTIDFGVTNGPDICCNFDWIAVDASVTRAYSGNVSGTVRYGSTGDYRVAAANVSVAGYCSTTTGTDGAYSLSLPVGTYTVACSKSGFANLQQSNVQVTQDGTTQQDFAFGAGRVYGTVTANTTGNPPIGGSAVATADGAFSTVTGTDGGYAFMLPSGTPTVVAGSPGYFSQSTGSFSLSNGGSQQKNFNLNPTNPQASDVALPSAPELSAPVGAPTVGDSFASPFNGGIGATSPTAPAIAECSRTVKADESFVLTGARFTLRADAQLGTDTTVWLYADSGSGGVLKKAKIWKVTDNQITATMPTDIPSFAMCVVWVENQDGISSPVCINRTQASWIGPLGNTGAAGTTKRVFGRNLSHDHGTTTTNVSVYIQPAGGGSFTSCSVSSANPYSVAFTVPSVSAGNYNVYVHNGSGGAYGWSDPVLMTIASAWTRNSRNQVVGSSYPSDDTTAIQNALNTMGGYGDGGTVTLNSGNYSVSSMLTIPAGVRLKGTDMNSTFLMVQGAQQYNYDCAVKLSGNHGTLEGLDIQVTDSTYDPSSAWSVFGDDCSVVGVKWDVATTTGTNYVAPWAVGSGGKRCEISGCEGYRQVNLSGDESWLHGTTLHGGIYNWQYGAESAINGPGARAVVEANTIQTDWPHNGNDYNYMAGYGVVDTTVIPGGQDQLDHMVWSKRMLLAAGGANCYIANNTCNNVAVQDNKGEMILLHGGVGAWFGNVQSSSGTTVNLRTDGLVDPGNGSAQAMTVEEIMGGSAVPDTYSPGRIVDDPYWGTCLTIIGGNGLGQVRRVVSHTRTSVTVDKPWRVQPDNTSRAALSFMYEGYLIYNNTMNAFPTLYDQWEYTASQTLQIGNGYANASEANVYHRTRSCTMLLADATAPTFWNDVRGDSADGCGTGGVGIGWWGINPAGEVILGNRVVDASWTASGVNTSYAAAVDGTGTIVEHNSFAGTRIGLVPPSVRESMYRANNVTVKNTSQVSGYWPPYVNTPCGVDFTTSSDCPLLVGNTYSSSDTYVNYYETVACPFAQKPVALYRVAKMSGFVGGQVANATIPIANAGVDPWTCSVSTNDNWISPSITGSNPIAAEGQNGELTIGVNTAGLSLGRHWGYVTLTGSGGNLTVGVCLDLSNVISQVQTPSYSPVAGTYGSAQSVTITCATNGASIRYTTDGTTPSDTVGTVYSSPVQISQNTTLKAVAYKAGMSNSNVQSGAYTISCAAPTFNPVAGTYGSTQSVTISSTTNGASIRYTTDGSTPSDTVGNIYSTAVNISANTTLKAIAYKTGMGNSTVTSGAYTINCAAPTFNPGAGNYGGTQSVTISSTTNSASIRYTTDGSTPSDTVGNIYSTPVNISANTTLKAIAYKTGMGNSTVTSGAYTFNYVGYNSAGTSNLTIGNGTMRACRFQAGASFTASQMSVNLYTSQSGKRIKCAIYSDSSGNPGSFVIGTNELTNPGTGWITFSLTSSQALTSSTYYWLVVWSEGTNYTAKGDGTGGTYKYKTQAYGSWPSSFGTPTGSQNWKWSIYTY